VSVIGLLAVDAAHKKKELKLKLKLLYRRHHQAL
jgi:hypothetical protein